MSMREPASPKPAGLLYGVDDRPPLRLTLLMGLQHALAMSSTLILPVVLVNEIGGSPATAVGFVQASMLASGVGTIVQALARGPVGSGYLCPSLTGPAFVPASLMAARAGGVALVCGMTVVAGLFQVLLSRLIRHLRALLPPEVTGVIVLMVGLSLVRLGVTSLVGIFHPDEASETHEIAVGFLTLGVMVAVTVWGGPFRLYGVLIGIAAGYAASYGVGLLGPHELDTVLGAPRFALPRPPILDGPSFDAALVVPFLIASLSSTAKTVGDLTTCQKINDPAWTEPDMRSAQRGVLADALAVVTAGLVGGMGQSTSSSNVGLCIATATTSRRIAYAAGGVFIALALTPVLAMTFVVMPAPVRGAILVFVACFMIVAGLGLIASQALDARRTFVVGGAIIAGLAVDVAPWVFKDLPVGLRVLSTSDLGVAAIVAVALNVVLHGVDRRR